MRRWLLERGFAVRRRPGRGGAGCGAGDGAGGGAGGGASLCAVGGIGSTGGAGDDVDADGEAATGLRRRALRRAWRLRRPDRWPMGKAPTGPLRRALRRTWHHWRRGHRLLAVTATWPR